MIHTVERRRTLNAFAGLQMAPTGASGPHAIAQVLAYAVPASGNGGAYTVLQIDTRSGITGYGECKPLSISNVQGLREMLVGKWALAYEALGPMAPEPARGGLNMALLGIVGKVTKAPVYRVLRGPTRFKARAIAVGRCLRSRAGVGHAAASGGRDSCIYDSNHAPGSAQSRKSVHQNERGPI